MRMLKLSPLAIAVALVSVTSHASDFSCEEQTLTPIYSVQGDGSSSPLIPDGEYISPDAYFVKGVVTKSMSSLYKGFFIQDAAGDDNEETSDGIFVYTGSAPSADIQPGMEVCVEAKVKEHYGMTQLVAQKDKVEVGHEVSPIIATNITVRDGETLVEAMERYEGMLVRLAPDSNLQITRNFGFDYGSYRNNMLLSHEAPLIKPTQLYVAGSEDATALAKQNAENKLYIDTDEKTPNGVIPYFPGLDAEQGYIRVGDQLVNLEGIIGFSYGQYRLIPTNNIEPADFIHQNDRTAAPVEYIGGNIKVASFNVLNLFTSASEVGGDLNATCSDQADADAAKGCNRGAKTLSEFSLQRTKIVNALKAMDADILGIMEMENNGFGANSAIANLVTELNLQFNDSADHYAYIEIADEDKNQGKYLGSDAIMVALIYRPAKVTPADDAQVIRMPEQHITGNNPDGEAKQLDKYQRDSLMQTFKIVGTKKKKETLSVVVNHLKSKGSGCYEDWINGEYEDDPADLQGHCNAFRVSGAMTLSQELKKVKGDLLVMGDMNAYGMEDPVRVLTDYKPKKAERKIMSASGTSIAGQPLHATGIEAGKGLGLINLASEWHGDDSYSYSYGGELGSLDHALANKSLKKKVVGIEDWHINSVENSLFEYSGKYSGSLAKSEGPYSASDHDPVIISLKYKMKKLGFTLKIQNKSRQPVYPVFNTWYWDSTKPWMMNGDKRTYTEKDRFLKHVGIKAGDAVDLSILAYGVYDVPCTFTPLVLEGKLKAVYNGNSCRIQ
ncbi:ExeM/NucH family extracellular endonuclease [Photobacterium indicum]|uniref:Endonuclease n=1 Tax=Photobacterium indicum TaxID=81447 RepID=A0A2T3L6L0_9GAMM|nr:ExeM/NucH family extracellular endonuclease [Photobacterium indicum]PSV45767.1 endonuclease [Photobacterium indicum]